MSLPLQNNEIILGFAKPNWIGSLDLVFEHDGQRTFLAKKEHYGPLVIQKTLHPEGPNICHGIVLHPPGGVAGGDTLTLTVHLNDDAKVLLTTPGAGKWYKANKKIASQLIVLDLEMAAQLEWFPQENILFNGAHVNFNNKIKLASDSKFATWDIVCFGRQASGEKWTLGEFRQGFEISRNGLLIWKESSLFKPSSPVMKSLMGLRGCEVMGNLIVAAGEIPKEILDECRKLEVSEESFCAVTALPEVFSARYLGSSSQEARQYFEMLWSILRPWYGNQKSVRPRIWNT